MQRTAAVVDWQKIAAVQFDSDFPETGAVAIAQIVDLAAVQIVDFVGAKASAVTAIASTAGAEDADVESAAADVAVTAVETVETAAPVVDCAA